MTDVTPTELEAAIQLIRSGKAPIRLTTPSEVLAAVKLGVIGPDEAHTLFGLPRPTPPEPEPSPKSWLERLLEPKYAASVTGNKMTVRRSR